MSRGLTTSQSLAAAAPVVRPVIMARLDFASGPVCVHTGVGTITYNGEDYLGVGDLGDISRVEEAAEVRPYSLQLTLSGIPPSLVAIAVGEHYQGRDCRLYLALLDANHDGAGLMPAAGLHPAAGLYPAPAGIDPIEVWRGRMDTADIEMGETATITVTAQSLLADWQRPRIRRYSHEDQQDLHPGDRGLEFVAAMVAKDIVWGRA